MRPLLAISSLAVVLAASAAQAEKRVFIVPEECLPGPMTWNAIATSYCFPFGEINPRTALPPDLHLTIK